MGQMIVLHEVNSIIVQKLREEPLDFSYKMSESVQEFNKNFDGLIFVLKKVTDQDQHNLLEEIFYPQESLTNLAEIEFSPNDMENFESWEDPIFWINSQKVIEINELLEKVSKRDLLGNYDAEELNQNQIYPSIWHYDERVNKCFNKRDIEKGFENLCKIFGNSVKNNNSILVFSS